MSKRPYRRPNDPELAQLYDVAMDAAAAQVGSDRAPGLITAVPSLAELRKTPGDVNGQAGPPAITVGGTTSPGDGGGDTYVWRPGSIQDDNNGDNSAGPGVVAVVGIDRGRWVRPSTADKTAALDTFTATAAGLVPPSGGGTTNFLRADGSFTAPPGPAGKTLLKRTVFTASATPAHTAGTTYARWRQWGGGGGGGGVIAGNGSTNATVAGGGAAGAKTEGETTTIPASWTIVIGAAGTRGSTAGGDGGAGGDTTVSDGVTTVIAKGGPGGKGWSAAASTTANARAGGSPPAIDTHGVVNGSGAPGKPGLILSPPNFVVSGEGGSTEWGGAGPAVAPPTFGGAGLDATGWGSGGSGACTSITAFAAAQGGLGKGGLVELEEWG